MDTERLQTLKTVVDTLQNGVTKTEFLSAIQQLLDFAKDLKKSNETEWTLIHSAFQMLEAKSKSMVGDIRADNEKELTSLKGTVDSRLNAAITTFQSIITSLLKEHETGMNYLRDKADSLQDGLHGQDGKDADDAAISEAVLSQIQPRLDEEFAKLREELTPALGSSTKAGWGAHPLTIAGAGLTKSKTTRHINFKGTGVSSVVRNPDGTVDVTITGGSGSFGIIAITGTVDNSNTSFTAASAPSVVVVNGATYRNGKGVTIVGTAITLDNPVGIGGDLYAL